MLKRIRDVVSMGGDIALEAEKCRKKIRKERAELHSMLDSQLRHANERELEAREKFREEMERISKLRENCKDLYYWRLQRNKAEEAELDKVVSEVSLQADLVVDMSTQIA